MNLLPTPPTDNLYKYMALTGTWLLVILFISWSLLQYSISSAEQVRNEVMLYGELQKGILKLKNKISLIENSKSDAQTIAGKSMSRNEAIIELKALSSSLEKESEILNKRFLKEHDDAILSASLEYPRLINIASIALLLMSLYLISVGYFLWFKRYQKPLDNMLIIDLRMKELELKDRMELVSNKLIQPTPKSGAADE